jgi:hypothetical protein
MKALRATKPRKRDDAMRTKTSLFLLVQLLPACADGPGDPNREPPGTPAGDDSSSSAGDASDSAMPHDGNDDVVDDGSSDDGGGESTDGAPEEMPCGDLCLAKAPSGWHGPAALIRSAAADQPPSCGESHPTELGTWVSDLLPQPAICDCNCGEAVGMECNSAEARVYANAGCENLIDLFDIGLSCANDVDLVEGYWNVRFNPPSGGECEPLPSFSIPPLDYTRWTLCGAELLEGECNPAEACTATPSPSFEEAQCIWQQGDVACPGDLYTERTVVYDAVKDDRSCGECSCASPQGTCAGGEVLLDTNANCPGDQWFSWYAEPGECLEFLFDSGQITEPATPFASCEPTMPVSLGGASLDQPFTLCCEAR